MNSFFKLWHISLSSVSIINVIIISYYSFFYKLSNDNIHKYLIIFSFIYSIACSFRAIWLKKPVQQLCLNNNLFSSPFFGRTIATIAELSFATQIITFIKFITKEIYTHNKINIPSFTYLNYLVPSIFVAQFFCWLACITKFHLWNAVEESIWTIFAIILLYHIYTIYPLLQNTKSNKKFTYINNLFQKIIPFIIIYIIFMIKIDIPTYINRWKQSDLNNDGNITFSEFIKDFTKKHSNLLSKLFNLFKCKIISTNYSDWKDSISFFSGYFTIAVWASIYIPIWYKNYKLL